MDVSPDLVFYPVTLDDDPPDPILSPDEQVLADSLRQLLGIEEEVPASRSRPEWRDDPAVVELLDELVADEWDMMSLALLDALERLDEADDQRASFDPTKHPRIPMHFEGGGRFRRLSDRIWQALRDWSDNKGPDDPLAQFNLPQLRKVARERGIAVRRRRPGEDEKVLENEVKNAILEDVRRRGVGQKPAGVPGAKKAPAKKAVGAAKKAPAKVAKKAVPAQPKRDIPRDNADIQSALDRFASGFGNARGFEKDQLDNFVNHLPPAERRKIRQIAGDKGLNLDDKNDLREALENWAAQQRRAGINAQIEDELKQWMHGDIADSDVLAGAEWNTLREFGHQIGISFDWDDSLWGMRERIKDLIADKMAGVWPDNRAAARAARIPPAPPGGWHGPIKDPEVAQIWDGLAGGVAEERRLPGGILGDTRLVRFNNGQRAVKKRAKEDLDWGAGGSAAELHTVVAQADAEDLVSRLGRAFGAPVPPVYRDDHETIYMGWIDGVDAMKADGNAVQDALDTDAAYRIALLDALIGNQDRHVGNWMVTKDGQPAGIDNGLGFLHVADPDGYDPHWGDKFKHLVWKGRWIDNDLSPDDIAHVRKKLKELEPQFARLGRQKWFDYAMHRLDLIEPHAKGKFNRIAPGGPRRPRVLGDAQRRAGRRVAQAVMEAPKNQRRAKLGRIATDDLRVMAGGRDIWFNELGGQTKIEQMPRHELLDRLGALVDPKPRDLAPAVLDQIAQEVRDAQGGPDWLVNFRIRDVLQRQPVGVMREIARLQGDSFVRGLPQPLARMPKQELMRLLLWRLGKKR